MLHCMDAKTTQALLIYLTAQTEYLALIARYYATLEERALMRAIPKRVLNEMRASNQEAANLAERIGAATPADFTPPESA